MNPTYHKVLHPTLSCCVTGRYICIIVFLRVQLDGVTYTMVIWTPYDNHHLSRSLEAIPMIS